MVKYDNNMILSLKVLLLLGCMAHVNYAVFVYFLSLVTLCSFAIDTVRTDTNYYNSAPYQKTNIISSIRKNIGMYVASRYHKSHWHSGTHTIDPLTCSAAQLARYFFYHRYTEEEILSLNTLYMSDEFVKLAKTYPGYEAAIIDLHKKLCKRSDFIKWLGSRFGTHCSGLTARIASLYRELQEQKQAEQAARQWQIEEQQRQTKVDNVYKQKLETIAQQPTCNNLRVQALEVTRCNPNNRVSRSISVNKAVLAYAEQYGIAQQDLTMGFMNEYEYELHTEFVEQLAQLSNLFDTYHLSKSENLFFDAIGEGVALGIEANKRHEPVIATCWANFGWEVLEIAKGIGEGVVLGACNPVSFAKNIVCHPINTTCEIVQGLGTIICAVGKAVGVPVQLGVLCITGNAEQACKESQKIYEQTKFLAQECATKIAAMSNREIAKQTAAFATDWVLTGKALTFAHSLCSRAGPLLVEVIEVLRKEPVAEYAIAGAEGVLHHMSKTTKQVGGAAKKVISSSRTLLESARRGLLANLEKEMAHLHTLFDRKIKGFAEFSNKYLKPDYEHILGMNLWFSRRGVVQIGGFHHDFMKIIEKSGVFRFTDKIMYKHKFYSAKLFHGENYIKHITFFPSHWTREQVISKIYEAYNNFIKSGVQPILEKNQQYRISGFTQEGINIEMFITKNGVISTAYPILPLK
jgi:hypothetical protein